MPPITLAAAYQAYAAQQAEPVPPAVRKFVTWCGDHIRTSSLTPARVEDYIATRSANDPQLPADWKAISAFLIWLKQQGHTAIDLTAEIELPKPTKLKERPLRAEEAPVVESKKYFYVNSALPGSDLRLGLDFGTSNSSAALFDGTKVTMFPVDPHNRSTTNARSLLYINRAGEHFIGNAALQTYFHDNTGRPVQLTRRRIGEYEFIASEMYYVDNLYVEMDEAEPGRFFQSLKTALRSTISRPTNVFNTLYTVEDLIAVFLAELKSRVEAQVGKRIDRLHVGRPVRYSLDEAINQAAAQRMLAACHEAGFSDVQFEYEPVAAALYYETTISRPQHVLVFDFGGGTLDVTVMRLGGGERKILALDGVPVGGDDLNARLVEGKLLRDFGYGSTYGDRRSKLPAYIWDSITRWQNLRGLLNQKTISFLYEVERSSTNPKAIRALRSLVTNNYGLSLYEEVEGAKIRLSDEEATSIVLTEKEISIGRRVERGEFEWYISPEVQTISDCLDRAVAAAGLEYRDIDVVLRTGGSSSVPLFVRMLADKFGPDKLREQDVFIGITAGLAIAAHNYRHELRGTSNE